MKTSLNQLAMRGLELMGQVSVERPLHTVLLYLCGSIINYSTNMTIIIEVLVVVVVGVGVV